MLKGQCRQGAIQRCKNRILNQELLEFIETPCSPGLDLWVGGKLLHHLVEGGLEVRGTRAESLVCDDQRPGDKEVKWETAI